MVTIAARQMDMMELLYNGTAVALNGIKKINEEELLITDEDVDIGSGGQVVNEWEFGI